MQKMSTGKDWQRGGGPTNRKTNDEFTFSHIS